MNTVSLPKESTLTDLTVITYDILSYIQLCEKLCGEVIFFLSGLQVKDAVAMCEFFAWTEQEVHFGKRRYNAN